MKTSIKAFSVLLACLLLTTAFAGCGTPSATGESASASPASESAAAPPASSESPATSSDGPDLSEPVVLKMYFIGDKAEDFDTVLEEINKKTSEKLNTTLDVSFISWADMDTKYPLVFASGEDFDTIFTADWCSYIPQAQKNGFMEITEDMLKQYAPITWAETPKESWDQVKINGKIFMVPQDHTEYDYMMVLIRGDLREKYGVPKIESLTSLSDLEPYLEAIAKNEPDMTPYGLFTQESGILMRMMLCAENEWGYAGGNFNNLYYPAYDLNDTSGKIFNMLETPEYLEMLERLRSWNQKGYISKSALTNKTIAGELMKAGKIGLMTTNYSTANDSIYKDFVNNHPDWKLEVLDATFGNKVLPYPALSGGIGINVNSKHADRVLMVVDYIRNDKEMNHLAQRGIEGVHWTVGDDGSDENVIDLVPGAKDYSGSFLWGPWRNRKYQPWPSKKTRFEGYGELLDSLKSREIFNPMQLFLFDDANCKNEMAAITSVYAQYGIPLEFGFVDPKEGLATFNEKMKQAGYDKVLEEMQKQADEYIKSR